MTRHDQLPLAPTGWDVRPLKRAARINRATLADDTRDDFEFRYIDISSVASNGRIDLAEPITFDKAPSRARRIVAPGDTVISTVRTYLKAIGRITEDQKGAIASTGFAVLTPRHGVDPDYLWRFVQSDEFVGLVQANSVGIGYPAIAPSDLGALPIFVPPLDTQRAIASFLGRETARIDTLVKKKRRLLDLLEEKRTALITRAVTQGLVHDVPVKDSGVEWIGEIPEHWDVAKLKNLAQLKSGDSITSSSIDNKGTYPVYGGGGLRGFTEGYTHEGDFALIGRQGALAGNIKYASGKFWASEHAVVVRPKRGVEIRWLGETLKAMNLNQYAEAAAQPGISVSEVSALPIPCPPIDDQRRIAAAIKEVSEREDQVAERVTQAIDLLQEYRTALISAAVTGRLHVTTLTTFRKSQAGVATP